MSAGSGSPRLCFTRNELRDCGRSGGELSRGNPMNSPQEPAEPRPWVEVRLRKHADYQRAYAAGRRHASATMSWFLAPQQAEPLPEVLRPTGPRAGLTVGKVIGKAHERNRIKRRMRDILRRHAEMLPAGFDLIFHPRRTVLSAEFTKLESEVVHILKQAQAEARSRKGQPAAPQP